MRLFLRSLLLLAAPLVAAMAVANAAPIEAVADMTGWQSRPQVKMRLVYGRLADGQPALGLVSELARGWHSYWKYAGASGFAPQFDWAGSARFKPLAPLYETPHRFFDEAGDYFGYEAGSMIAIPIAPAAAPESESKIKTKIKIKSKSKSESESILAPESESAQSETALAQNKTALAQNKTALAKNETIKVRLNVNMGVCQKICVPLQFAFAGDIAIADFNNSLFQPLFDAHEKARPRPPNANLKATALHYDGRALYIDLHSADATAPELIIGGLADDAFARPHYVKQGKNLWQARVPARPAAAPFIGRRLELILSNSGQNVQQFMQVAPFAQ